VALKQDDLIKTGWLVAYREGRSHVSVIRQFDGRMIEFGDGGRTIQTVTIEMDSLIDADVFRSTMALRCMSKK